MASIDIGMMVLMPRLAIGFVAALLYSALFASGLGRSLGEPWPTPRGRRSAEVVAERAAGR